MNETQIREALAAHRWDSDFHAVDPVRIACMCGWSEVFSISTWEAHVVAVLAALPPGDTALVKAALHAAADEMEAVIADGDVAEVAAPVPGEVGRGACVAARDALYEDPAGWLREYAGALLSDAHPGGDEPTAEDGLAVAEHLLRKIVDYWDGRPLRVHGEHIYADLLDVLKAITPSADAAAGETGEVDRG